MPIDIPKVTLEDVQLLYRNFSGIERAPFNPAGERNFCVFLPEDLAEQMERDSWNIKRTKPDEEDAEEGITVGKPYVQVKVNFKNKPPKITMYTSTSKTFLTEETVGMLDGVDIREVDMTITGFDWNNPDPKGPQLKAYLRTMYITIDEDDLDNKYAKRDEVMGLSDQ